jgi:hypothetical protein
LIPDTVTRASLAALALLLLPSPAAALPDQLTGILSNSSALSSLSVSEDARFIAGSTSSGAILVWDSAQWGAGPTTVSPGCTATAVQFVDFSLADRLWVGCDDGSVLPVDLDPDDIPFTWTVQHSLTLQLAVEGSVTDLAWTSADSYVHAAVQVATQLVLARFTIGGDAHDQPLGTALTGTANAIAIGEATSPIVITRNDGFVNWITRSGTSYTNQQYPLLALASAGAVSASTEAGMVLVADRSGDAVWNFPVLGGFTPTEFGSFDAPTVVTWGDSDSGPVAWIAESGGDLVALDASESEQARVDLGGIDASHAAAVGGEDGLVVVAGSGGSIHIIAGFAFVEALAVSPDSVGEDEDFDVTFTLSEDADWDLRIDSGLTESAGTSLATGSATAGTETTVTLGSRALTAEGSNRLFLFVDNGGGIGLDSVVVTLDGPPGALTGVSAGVADSRLDLVWTAGPEADIADFEVFVSDAPFTAGDLPTFQVAQSDGSVDTYPRDFEAGEPSTAQQAQIPGLTNGVTYYLAVRAVDAGGQIGPLSGVVGGQPAGTCSAAECAGDTHGCTCSEVSTTGAGLVTLLLGPLVWRRRSSRIQ